MKLDSRIILAIAIAISLTLPTKATASQSYPLAQASPNPTSANNIDLNRAKNLARQAAEAANGGLSQYRAENSMHGAAEASPFVDSNGIWTFTFKGKKPDDDTFTIETVVSVSKDGKQVNIDYNGPIRQK